MQTLYNLFVLGFEKIHLVGVWILRLQKAGFYWFIAFFGAIVFLALKTAASVIRLTDYVVGKNTEISTAVSSGMAPGGALASKGAVAYQVIQFVNTFIPLYEMVIAAFVLTNIWVLASLVRLVKSWIPTIN